MAKFITVYYDNEPEIGVNAYFPWGHEYFRTYQELKTFCDIEYGGFADFVEITDDNYPRLVAQGVLNAD